MDDIFAQLRGVFRDEALEKLDELAQLLDTLKGGVDSKLHRELIHGCFRIAHNIKGAARMVGIEAVETLTHAMEDTLATHRDSGTMLSDSFVAQLVESITIIGRIAEGEELTREALALARAIADARPKVDLSAASDSQVTEEQEEGTTAEPLDGLDPVNPVDPVDAPHTTAHPLSDGLDPVDAPHTKQATQAPSDVPASGETQSAAVKVEAGRLDSLMARAGELLSVNARLRTRHAELTLLEGQIREACRGLPAKERAPFDKIGKGLEELTTRDRREVQNFGYLAHEINEATKRVRMLPAANAASLWRRVVRETSVELGKEVRLTIEVGELELDKDILQGLQDPMMHLLRNAVAHGIEEPEERRRVGKPAVGQVVVRATTRGAMAGLEVSDDGRGVDPHKIGEEAVRRGLWVADELSRADPKQILDLLFAPGFSTATTTDRVSGRGVGLDVVRRRVDELDGTVTIGKPTLGGATFVLSVPVSHVSLSGLLVAAGRQTYALPVEHVQRTLRVDSRSIESVDGAPIARSDRHEPLRLYWLATLMQRKRGVDPLQLTAVEVKLNGRRYGLVVDEVIGEEKFVAQRLPPYLKGIPGFQGAMVLGDGSLALVLDIPELVASLAKRTDNAMGLAQHTVSRRAPTILVVDDSLTSRTLVHNFLKTAGYQVKVTVDGAEAWQVIKSSEVDLVIADVEMPNVDGIELTRRIRADEKLNNTPVIIVSSLGSPEDIARGAAAGADEYVVKGQFDQRLLLEAISRLI